VTEQTAGRINIALTGPAACGDEPVKSAITSPPSIVSVSLIG